MEAYFLFELQRCFSKLFYIFFILISRVKDFKFQLHFLYISQYPEYLMAMILPNMGYTDGYKQTKSYLINYFQFIIIGLYS